MVLVLTNDNQEPSSPRVFGTDVKDVGKMAPRISGSSRLKTVHAQSISKSSSNDGNTHSSPLNRTPNESTKSQSTWSFLCSNTTLVCDGWAKGL